MKLSRTNAWIIRRIDEFHYDEISFNIFHLIPTIPRGIRSIRGTGENFVSDEIWMEAAERDYHVLTALVTIL